MNSSGESIFERIRRGRRPGHGRTAGRPAAIADNGGSEVTRPPAWMRWLPAAYVVFVLLLETVTPTMWAVSFLLIALPVIAAYTLGPVGVAAVTVFAVVLEGVLAGTPCCTGHNIHQLWANHYVAAYIATGLVGILGVALAAHRRRQERHLVRANSVAEALMRTLLRPVPHRVGQVLAAGLYRSGEVGTMVGGDLYDIRATPDGERAIIGDVRGKGLKAVRTVADILGSFREAVYEQGDLLAVAARMERRLAREAEELPDDELFATAALIEYDAPAGRVTIVNHGHIEPVLISDGEVTALTGPPALPLGLGTLADEPPVAYTHRFTHGDVLLLCTDGLIEARDRTGAFYPLLDRLSHRFAGRPAPGPCDVIDFLNTDLPRHTRVFHDDVALLAIAPLRQK
ncbi:PP2C family protein-serine/threonine phosphatase [Streptomyces inhibens]|uniref:PP2C family protein-serine/threonine phosphatase n=1 Tax=Streptomyces inhibens TaxID=2293571 RepID=UPI001EE76915|nr:PP2C family protein-serine/threonine phosphatase [Streptomyces inhibens]UKY53230.1 serine/threonine-protein phosphatase [Streptomyces inhibens]